MNGASKMKKSFKIEVDCPNCANQIENALKKIEEVSDVTVNFITQKMSVEFSACADEKNVLRRIIKVAKKIDSDFEVEI